MLKEIWIKKRKDNDLEKIDYYYFIRINPDKKGFNDYEEFSRVQKYISESTKNQTQESVKKSLNDDLPKRLLELEFRLNHSIKLKCLQSVVKKVMPDYKNVE